jgi:energy-converting hydrogenase Eha subunit G
MVRNILAVIGGMAVSGIVIMLLEGLSPQFFEMPQIRSADDLHKFITEAPPTLHLFILACYAVGSFTGGAVAAAIATNKKITRAMTVGGISMGFGLFNLMTLHHPVWVVLLSLFMFLPFAWMGGKLGMRMSKGGSKEPQ